MIFLRKYVLFRHCLLFLFCCILFFGTTKQSSSATFTLQAVEDSRIEEQNPANTLLLTPTLTFTQTPTATVTPTLNSSITPSPTLMIKSYDLNQDEHLNISDFLIFREMFLEHTERVDFNFDKKVDIHDVLLFSRQWRNQTSEDDFIR